MPTIENNALVAPASPASAAPAPIFNFPASFLQPTTPSTSAKPVATISTEQGQNTLQKTVAQATKLSGAPQTTTQTTTTPVADTKTTAVQTPAPTETKTPAPTSTKVTLINPDTEQTVRFDDASINKESIQSYLNAGYKLSDASGALPTWLSPSGVSKPTNTDALLTATQTATAQAKSDLAAATAKLTSFNVSNDPQLQTLLSGITAQWDTRIQDMQNSENSHIAALTTTGIRLGSQYTGGLGGMTGSIISAEERNAVNQIGILQNQKQQALAAAQSAFETQAWTRYNDLVQIAQKAYDSQVTQLQTLQKAQADQDAKLQTMQQTATMNGNVAKLYGAGTTSPSAILASLQKSGDKTTTLDDINKAITALTPAGIPDLVKTMTANGAPASAVQAVLKSADLNAAYTAAGPYAAGGTGMVGEYNFYKAQATAAGQTPVDFNTYQNMDANRKASASAAANAKYSFDFATTPGVAGDPGSLASGNGKSILAATGLSYNGFLALTGNMSSLPRDQVTRNKASAEVQAFANARGVDVSTLLAQYKAYNGVLSSNIARYSNTKIMEGEIDKTATNLTKAIGSNFSSLNVGNVAALFAGKQVNDPTVQKYRTQLVTLQNDLAGYLAASRSVNSDGTPPTPDQHDLDQAASIVQNGISSGGVTAFQSAISDSVAGNLHVLQSNIDSNQQNIWDLLGVGSQFQPRLTSTQLAANEKSATAAISTYVQKNPAQADEMAKAADATNPKTGQKYSATEIAQIFGIDTTAVDTSASAPLPTAAVPSSIGAGGVIDWGKLFSGGGLSLTH